MRANRIPVLLLIGLIVSTALSIWAIRQEQMVVRYQLELDHQSGAIARQDPGPGLAPGPLPAFAPPRVLLADALYSARLAARLSDGRLRRMLFARAHRETSDAQAARPHWGEAWVSGAYIASLAQPGFSESERLALIRSYQDVPYLKTAGLWRITRGLAHWAALPRSVQDNVVDETVWLINISPPEFRADLFQLARQSTAYRAVFLRWNALQRR